jgi:tRNA G46 methylase TrmB
MSVPPKYVLDIATGTGIWAREFAEQNPSSYVIGSDLSAIQPETLLPNLAFTKDDAEDVWVFPRPPRRPTPSDWAADDE